MIQTILNEIQDAFFAELDTKTGWGKNDIKAAYKDAVISVLKKNLNELLK